MQYLFVIERARNNVAGYFPDVSGYGAAADRVEELIEMAREGIAFHLEGETPPKAHSLAWHLRKGLQIRPTDLLAWVDYEPESVAA